MGAIVSAIFLYVVCAIHAMGADVYATDAIVGVVSFTDAVVSVIYAMDAIVSVIYAMDAVVSVIHVTEGVVCAIHVSEDFVGAIHVKEDSVYAIHVTDGFVGVIHATDGSAYVTGAVIVATDLFCDSISSMGDTSVIPVIVRKRKFGSHRHQCKRGEKRNEISNATTILNSSAPRHFDGKEDAIIL